MLSEFLYTVGKKTAPVRTLFLYAKSCRKQDILVVDLTSCDILFSFILLIIAQPYINCQPSK